MHYSLALKKINIMMASKRSAAWWYVYTQCTTLVYTATTLHKHTTRHLQLAWLLWTFAHRHSRKFNKYSIHMCMPTRCEQVHVGMHTNVFQTCMWKYVVWTTKLVDTHLAWSTHCVCSYSHICSHSRVCAKDFTHDKHGSHTHTNTQTPEGATTYTVSWKVPTPSW